MLLEPFDSHPIAQQNLRRNPDYRLANNAYSGADSRPADPTASHTDIDLTLWSLRTVLAHVPISRSAWLSGVKEGRYPPPVKLSPRRVAWRVSDIRAFLASL